MGGMPSVSNVLSNIGNATLDVATLGQRKKIGGTVGDVLNDPGRAVNAISTMGMSELANAADNKLFNDPRNKAEDAAVKQADAANKMIDQQMEERAQQDRIKTRDLSRARQRSMSANAGGRSSTILTGPSGVQTGYVPGRKTLLGQ